MEIESDKEREGKRLKERVKQIKTEIATLSNRKVKEAASRHQTVSVSLYAASP